MVTALKTLGNSAVKHTDCLTFLSDIATDGVDLIATDPPYEINLDNLDWDQKGLDWDAIGREFKRVLKPTGSLVIFQGWSSVLHTRKHLDNYFTLKNWIIYDRVKGRGAKTNLVSTREDILWYIASNKGYTYNKIPSTIKKRTGGTIGRRNGSEYRAMSNVWSDISPIVPWSQERVAHPTQKPLQLMERIINIFSNPGDLVCDPFCGSGSTVVAAVNLGRNCLASDINSDYCTLTERRVKACQMNLEMEFLT